MRKYLILYIMLACLPMAARGQTITNLADIDLSGLPQPTMVKALRYWFDDDAASVQATNQLSGSHELDVSGLINGIHVLHYQVIDDRNVAAYVSSGIFLKMNSKTGANPVKSLRYWFDNDDNSMKNVSSASIQTLDVSALLDGLHTIHYQVTGSDGVASYVASGLFLKTNNSHGYDMVKASKLMYWFDDETTIQDVDISQGVQMLDTSGLIDGLHTIHYQLLCNNGQMTPTMSSLFLRMSIDAETAVAKSLRYWFDDSQMAVEVAIADGVQLLDASALIEGLHTIHYQIVDSKGMLGTPYSSLFLKMDASASTVAQSLRYWFDDDAATVTTTSVAGRTQTLDVSALLRGLHTLHYQLIDSRGQVTTPVTCLFMKNFDKVIEEGENHVTKYQYWQNRNSQAKQTVQLDDVANPYSLIALLPTQKEPIRSSLFHFEVTDGQPTIYAKNTFHIRFIDAQNYFIDGEKPFIDYSVKQEVEPVGELQSKQTFQRVEKNEIRWYTMQSAPGDTAAFRMSQAATVQVFAPSGKEVFKTSESSSVQWAGIHTWENGTYYLAVHDVTGSQNTMTLDYMHMDKYDVVDWDVHTVGNGGCSTITFKGNGFRDLYAVDLYTAEGDTIHSVDVSHESDAETAVTFDFTGAELDVYNAVFHFTEEDKVFTSIVYVEEAININLATTTNHSSLFLKGGKTIYTFNVENTGNMTAYKVPIYAYISCKTLEGISHINLKGLKLKGLYDYIDNKDSIDRNALIEIEKLCYQIGEDHYFTKYATIDEQTRDSIIVRSGFFTIDLPPNTSKTISIEIQATEKINVWLSIPEDWHRVILDDGQINNKIKSRKTAKDWFCCYHERLECLATIIVDVADIVGILPIPQAKVATVVSCVTGAINQIVKSTANVICNEEEVKKNFYEQVQSIVNGISVGGTIMTCVSGLVKDEDLKVLLSCTSLFYLDTSTAPFALADCYVAWTQKKPNCPPNSGGGGGTSTPYTPIDPNDIYGYLSDAGSRFIADSVARVNYTIEFENDTAFATAAAHTIVIRDTLDSEFFDLKAFLPTCVKIGEKEVFLDETSDVKTEGGVTSFLKTIDMRPAINAIAQVEGTYSQMTGIAEWRFTSLDPMTMEPTDDLMQGILPVNYDGTSGIGEVMFEIGVKPNKGDGTQIPNRAGIVFDYEEAILTPTWVNIVDAVAPTSTILGGIQTNDSTLTLRLAGEDERSGVWKYNVYAQMGQGASWELVAENVQATAAEDDDAVEGEPETLVDVRIYDGIEYSFLVLATDSAGNVERKSFEEADFQLTTVMPGDANGDGTVDALDVVLATSYYLGNDVYLNFAAADVVEDGEINSLDVIAIQNIYLNATNGDKAMGPRKRTRKLKR